MARGETRRQIEMRIKHEEKERSKKLSEFLSAQKLAAEEKERRLTNFDKASQLISGLNYQFEQHSKKLISIFDLLVDAEIDTTLERLKKISTLFKEFVEGLDEPSNRGFVDVKPLDLPPKDKMNNFDKALDKVDNFLFHIFHYDEKLLVEYATLVGEERNKIKDSCTETQLYLDSLIAEIETSSYENAR